LSAAVVQAVVMQRQKLLLRNAVRRLGVALHARPPALCRADNLANMQRQEFSRVLCS
jgi:hypothetical protein